MRRSIEELRTFYGEPAGALARRLLARRLEDAWGEATNCDVLGLGYATPWLDAFVGARRVVAAMPGAAGVVLLEATRHAYARIRPGGAVATAPVLTPALQPQPASRSGRDLSGLDLAGSRERP